MLRTRADRLETCFVRFLLAILLSGCGSGQQPTVEDRITPSLADAQDALERALTAWRNAVGSPSKIVNPPNVIFVDRQRGPDQRLRSYEILGQTLVDHIRQFTVRLITEPSGDAQLVRYHVLGRGPIWVYREEDLAMMMHWEHDMRDADGGTKSRPDAPDEPNPRGSTDRGQGPSF